jgi:2-oxoglutarate ferredoxin oxidoreductase subunit gamma
VHSLDEVSPSSAAPEAAESYTEVRLSGSGGQGILLAAALLADAALQSGKQVVQTQSYGPEARGGASKAEIILSAEEIDYPEVRHPDFTLCLSQPAFDRYSPEAPAGSVIYYDSGLVEPSPTEGVALYGAPFTDIASLQLGKTVVTNIVALGALAKHSGIADHEELLKALGRRLPQKLVALNEKALALGAASELAQP